ETDIERLLANDPTPWMQCCFDRTLNFRTHQARSSAIFGCFSPDVAFSHRLYRKEKHSMRWLKTSRRPFADRVRRARTREICPQLDALESRLLLYSASGNAWPHPQLITISFEPDGTNLSGYSSNLFSTFNAKFGSTSAWENAILTAAQLWAQQTNINF